LRVRKVYWRVLIVVSLCLAICLPSVGATQRAAAFSDVTDMMSCDTPVQQLVRFGILRGYVDGSFGLHDPLLRAQAAATIVRAADWSTENPQQTFSDQGTTDAELWRSVRVLADRGVANGFPDGTFAPMQPLSRQEALSFIARLLITLGNWQPQGSAPYGDVTSSHATDVATYLHYVGSIPQIAPGTMVIGATQTADRCWYAEALWNGLRQLPSYHAQAGSTILDTPTPLYWGAYINGSPWDLDSLNAFESRAGKGSSLVHWGQAWWRDGRYQPFQADMATRVRDRGSIPLIDWGSWDASGGTNQPRFGLAGIARGEHDAYLRSWAAGAAAWGHPLFLRFNWEMNGWWQFPWSAQLNGNTAGDYVAAWRHVREVFEATGATNVTWVWCPNVVSKETTPLAALYPGDAYVDWVALDGYNWGGIRNEPWRSFAEIYGSSYSALRQLAPTKPIMIAEVASAEQGGDKAAWIRDAFGTQLPTRFPAIKAVVWFNWNDGNSAYTWPIESSGAASAAFGTVIGGSSSYLPNRFKDLPARRIVPFVGTP